MIFIYLIGKETLGTGKENSRRTSGKRIGLRLSSAAVMAIEAFPTASFSLIEFFQRMEPKK